MNRLILTAAALPFLAPAAAAQDMPLSQILIDGEGWKHRDPGNAAEDRMAAAQARALLTRGHPPWMAYSPDRSVRYHATGLDGYVWAAQADPADPKMISGGLNPYCPLRMKPDRKAGGATALTVDKDGRIYAATPLGIQVFDPTGRLCGVVTAPPGKVDVLGFEGDRLTAWVGNTVYFRKLKTSGVR